MELPHRVVSDNASTLNFEAIIQNGASKTVYMVKDYGAKGDGKGDDATSIQRALDAAYDAGGGTVYAPAGTYIIGSRIDIDGNVSLIGDGAYATYLKCSASGAGLWFNDNDTRSKGRRGGMSGRFTLDMNTVSTQGIYIGSVNRSFEDIRTTYSAANSVAMLVDQAQNNTYVGIDLSIDDDAGPSGATGLQIDRSASGNWFYGLRVNQATDDHIKITASAAPTIATGISEPNNNMVIGALVERTAAYATSRCVRIEAGQNNTFIHCVFSQSTDETINTEHAVVAVEATGTYGGSVSRNNHFKSCTFQGDDTTYCNAVDLEATSGDSTGRTVVEDCRAYGNNHFFAIGNNHGTISRNNSTRVGNTAAFYKSGAWKPNYAVEAISSNAITPAYWGSLTNVTGTTNLETINTYEVPSGFIITLHSVSGFTVKHGTGNIYLNGLADFAMSAGDRLTLVNDGTTWYEVGRYT